MLDSRKYVQVVRDARCGNRVTKVVEFFERGIS